MKQRNLYYRRKGNKIIVEGKMNKKTIFLFTLPEPSKLLNASFLTEEKIAKINEKIKRLDYRSEKKTKEASKVRTTDIIRTSEKDDNAIDVNEEINELQGRIKPKVLEGVEEK